MLQKGFIKVIQTYENTFILSLLILWAFDTYDVKQNGAQLALLNYA